jgi:hydroxymethylglutaryl-CoA lyase
MDEQLDGTALMKRSDADNNLPSKVRLVEVGPRDGLQNEPPPIISTSLKVELIQRLAECGLTHIEAASLVSPQWVPQMADSRDVLRKIERKSGVRYTALTPNEKGVEQAIACGANEIAVFTAASEAFCQKNINCSIGESLKRFQPAIQLAIANKVPVRGYVSTTLGCPYSGEISPGEVARVCHALDEMGCYEISLGDTIGTGTPLKVKRMLQRVKQSIPARKLAVHFHDTYGQALANIYAALQEGISVIDSSVAGLGGCPYARGASGNVATEDVLYMLDGLGINTGVNLNELVSVSHWICQQLNCQNNGNVSQALNGRH